MKEAADISWGILLISELLLFIPIAILAYYKTGLVKASLIAVARMTGQLMLVSVYIGYIFKLNNPWINTLWVLVMIVVACFTITKRGNLKPRYFVLPFFFAISISLAVVISFFLGFTVQLDSVFEAQYFIPITGMMIGNILQSIIMASSTFYHSLATQQTSFRFSIINGAHLHEAVFPFVTDALKKSFNPMIAQMAVLGLISLPGMMTGQILGGNDPTVAIKYQIMMMVSIFSVSVLSVFLSILFSMRFIFDERLNLRKEVMN